MQFYVTEIPSPIGIMTAVTDGEALRALEFEDRTDRLHRLLRLHYGAYVLTPAPDAGPISRRLRDYFAGDLPALDHIPTATAGTPFQRQVWAALRAIPPGATTSYGVLAAQLARATASRAVGAANGANPVSIVVPCHRVIGANAKLTGYAGGLPRKEWLLAHERRFTPGAQGGH